jgi:hypothetical protein
MTVIWAYTDEQSNILAFNHNNMDGNSGWTALPRERMTAHTGLTIAEVMDSVSADGVAQFAIRDGFVEFRSKSEMDADRQSEVRPAQTIASRVETLEKSNAELAEAVDMILSGVTE